MPQWAHFNDPKSLTHSIRDWLLGQGVKLSVGEVRNVTPGAGSPLAVKVNDGSLQVDRVVIAAGVWSAKLAHRLGDHVLLESERGYNMTLPRSGISVTRELVFAERKFVATPLSCGLRIGGAAEFGGLNAAPNFKRSQALVELARQYLPDLQTEGGTSWAGHRPTTPDSLPVIGCSKQRANVFYAFGHGHLGLTLAATTGRLLSDLIFGKQSSVDMSPYDIGRFSRVSGRTISPPC
jgi:D-amino-acid dehydrogenase